MRVVTWDDGQVSTSSSVTIAGEITGSRLRDAYVEASGRLTFGLIQLRGNAVRIGPVQLVRFGPPKVTRNAVDWPIEGGLLARGPGGHWRLQAGAGLVQASLTGYRPALPRLLYVTTHLPVHQLFTRLFLLRLHGRGMAPGVAAPASERTRAAAVDAAFCLTLAGLMGQRRLRRTLAIAVVYHVACWTIGGATLGGLVMRQRVVAVDGSRLTAAQSLVRLALLPAALLVRRPIHDDVAGTQVIKE